MPLDLLRTRYGSHYDMEMHLPMVTVVGMCI